MGISTDGWAVGWKSLGLSVAGSISTGGKLFAEINLPLATKQYKNDNIVNIVSLPVNSKEPNVSGRHRKAFSSLQWCLTDSSWIHMFLLIELFQYKIGKTRMAFDTNNVLWWFIVATALVAWTQLTLLTANTLLLDLEILVRDLFFRNIKSLIISRTSGICGSRILPRGWLPSFWGRMFPW